MINQIQYERRFSHGRTGRNQDEVGGLQARCLVIQIDEACRDSRYGSLVFGGFLNFLENVHRNLTDGDEITGITAL